MVAQKSMHILLLLVRSSRAVWSGCSPYRHVFDICYMYTFPLGGPRKSHQVEMHKAFISNKQWIIWILKTWNINTARRNLYCKWLTKIINPTMSYIIMQIRITRVQTESSSLGVPLYHYYRIYPFKIAKPYQVSQKAIQLRCILFVFFLNTSCDWIY